MNEIILNYIAVIIGVAFLSAVIIGTAPPVVQDVDNPPPDLHHNATIHASSRVASPPLTFGSLFTYYGNKQLDVNGNSNMQENAGPDVLLSVQGVQKRMPTNPLEIRNLQTKAVNPG